MNDLNAAAVCPRCYSMNIEGGLPPFFWLFAIIICLFTAGIGFIAVIVMWLNMRKWKCRYCGLEFLEPYKAAYNWPGPYVMERQWRGN